MSNKIIAIVPAGIHADPDKLIHGKNKAFLEINGKPIILNVLQALQNSSLISRIGVVGPKKELEKVILEKDGIKIINQSLAPKESRRFIENYISGANALSQNSERILYVMADLPSITSKTIDNFILETEKYNAHFNFGMINVRNIPKEIEQFKKSRTLHLKNKGNYRTANLVLYNNKEIEGIKLNQELLESEIERAFPIRRTTSPYSRARLGWFLWRRYPIKFPKYFVMGLKEEEIISAFRKKPKFELKIIDVKDPRAAVEVDYLEEYEYLTKHFDYLTKELDSKYPLI